jgi:D-alanine-D-alanine ligase
MVVPAPLDPAVTEKIRDLSVRAFRAVGGWGLARVDFLLDATTGDAFINELNTLPGFTAYSMYPKVWAAAGLSYPDLLARLVDLAFDRHNRQLDRRKGNSLKPSERGLRTCHLSLSGGARLK